MLRIVSPALLLLAAAAGSSLAARADVSGPTLTLQRGQWVVTSRDGGPSRKLCLKDPAQLVQLRHGSRACSRQVVEAEANEMTVQYTCKGNGYGRTTVRKETDSLAQIESQGVEGRLPFQFTAEARRVGACR